MNIAEFLELGHIGNFRLCCRAFSIIALPQLLRRVVVFRHHDSLRWLEMLSREPALSKHIRCLHFEIDVLEEPVAPFEEYAEEINSGRLFAARAVYPPRFDYALYHQPLTRNKLRESYDMYEMAVDFQSRFIKQNHLDFGLWLMAIQAAHNLDSLVISSDFHFRSDPFPKSPYRVHCINDSRQLEGPVGKGEFNVLMLCAGIAGRQLTSLQAGVIHWSLFEDLDGQYLDTLLIPLENLTTLELIITTGTEDDSDRVGFEAEECAAALSEGGLARFIKRLSKLHKLSVGFDFHDEDSFCFGASSEAILDPHGYWPHLYEIELSCISVDADHMSAFFKKHSATLKDLRFSKISLESSLQPFFSEIRNVLSLRNFDVYGQLWGLIEDGSGELDVEWSLRWPEQKCIERDALRSFVLDKGEYPLTWDRLEELEAKDNFAEENE
jgi:hypothetical protein